LNSTKKKIERSVPSVFLNKEAIGDLLLLPELLPFRMPSTTQIHPNLCHHHQCSNSLLPSYRWVRNHKRNKRMLGLQLENQASSSSTATTNVTFINSTHRFYYQPEFPSPKISLRPTIQDQRVARSLHQRSIQH
jgi:hypothetical protein